MNVPELPPFLLEPLPQTVQENDNSGETHKYDALEGDLLVLNDHSRHTWDHIFETLIFIGKADNN